MASTAENAIRATRRASRANGADFARLRRNVDKTVRRARKSAMRGMDVTDAYVHKHPWAAVGLATGAMALAGIALFATLHRPRTARRALMEGLGDLRRATASRLGARRH